MHSQVPFRILALLRMRIAPVLAAAVIATMSGWATAAPAQSDQDRAREELLDGKILSYDQILRQARKAVPGRVVGQDLVRDRNGDFVYRLKIMRPDGKVVLALLDARTGRLLSLDGRRQ